MRLLEQYGMHVYFVVWAVLALSYGYLTNKKPDDKSLPFGEAVLFGM